MPNRNELQSIVDYSTYSPAIDTTYFPDTMSYLYWSSTTNHADNAWFVAFNNGSVNSHDRSDGNNVRAVRGGQCGSFGDSDGDTVCDDGDDSGTPGDNPCTGGEILFCDDNCPDNYNPNQEDSDGDGLGDVCDDCTDTDGDGFGNPEYSNSSCEDDNCPDDYNPNQEDAGDGDGAGDICDNCPVDINPNQEDEGDHDGLGDVCDNCLTVPNGSDLGTCFSWSGMARGTTCLSDADCGGLQGSCCMNQEDTYPPQGNGIGDVCDCEADFTCDGDVDADDVTAFLWDFGRSEYNNPCTNDRPCYGDFSCDEDMDADDVTMFLEDFGRSQFFNPCPACVAGDWCLYP